MNKTPKPSDIPRLTEENAQLQAELDTVKAERDAAIKEIGKWSRKAGLQQDELSTARKTNSKLHRRCQIAEAVVTQTIEGCKRQGISLGRGLANAGYYKLEADNERLRGLLKKWVKKMQLSEIYKPLVEECEQALKKAGQE